MWSNVVCGRLGGGDGGGGGGGGGRGMRGRVRGGREVGGGERKWAGAREGRGGGLVSGAEASRQQAGWRGRE